LAKELPFKIKAFPMKIYQLLEIYRDHNLIILDPV
jgi:hypothetical protein